MSFLEPDNLRFSHTYVAIILLVIRLGDEEAASNLCAGFDGGYEQLMVQSRSVQ